MRQKFMRDREADDRAETAKIWSSVILGNNRKRKRGEVEFEELDEASKKKLKRIEQRMEQEWNDDDDDQMVEIDLKAVKQGDDSGDEMSETERRLQDEQNDYFKFQKAILEKGGEQKLYSRFTDLRQKQKKEEEELMAKMISSESTSAGQLSKPTPKLNKQVSRVFESNFIQGSMLDRKKVGADLRTSEDHPTFKFGVKETGK